MATARVAFGVLARMIRATPKPSERKKAHSCETPRSLGLTRAIASAVASLAALARSPTASLAALARSPIASRAAVARSPIRSAPLRRSSTMSRRVARHSCRVCGIATMYEQRTVWIECLICGFRPFFRPALRRSCGVTPESRCERRSSMSKTATQHPQKRSAGPLDRATVFDCRRAPLRRDRVGDPRRGDRQSRRARPSSSAGSSSPRAGPRTRPTSSPRSTSAASSAAPSARARSNR